MGDTASSASGMPPLIAHVVHQFGTGGMENGMANLINRMPRERYRHAIVCLDGYTDFSRRINRDDVSFHALGKKPGQDPAVFARLWKLLRSMRPDIVHTRNLSALEAQFVAAAAGVRGRIHGEHGRDVFDIDGSNWKYNLLRRAARPLIHRYISVSRDLERWLCTSIGVQARRVSQIYNGVDQGRFRPRAAERPGLGPAGFVPEGGIVIGSVGRMAEVKDYPSLARAFGIMLAREPALKDRLRLVIIGDGPSRNKCISILKHAELDHLAWLPGERDDIPELMRAMDLFVLPSIGEGISNTILEAMASALPVVATQVGGNPELVQENATGRLVPPAAPDALAAALLDYVCRPPLMRQHGEAARRRIERQFSMEAMAEGYLNAYDEVVATRGIGHHAGAALDCEAAPALTGKRK